MFEQIRQHPDLFGIERGSCEENSLCIAFCDLLKSGEEIDDKKVRILKVDSYYRSSMMHNPPPAIDCMIIINLGENRFDFYLIELRDVTVTKLVRPDDIVPKFKTVVEKFLLEDFSEIFLSSEYTINRFELWLVTDPFHAASLTEEQYKKKIQGTVLDKFQAMKPLKFRDKIAMIKPKRPTPEICL